MTVDEVNETIQMFADEFKANWQEIECSFGISPLTDSEARPDDVLTAFIEWLQEYQGARP